MIRRLAALCAFGALLALPPPPARAIGFIDSPTAYCRKVKGNRCTIGWAHLSVDASPNYMTDVWVFVEEKLVFHASGFFQTSMFVANELLGDGVPVKCGAPGTTPVTDPNLGFDLGYGNQYAYRIHARDSAGLKSANYGTVVCPPK